MVRTEFEIVSKLMNEFRFILVSSSSCTMTLDRFTNVSQIYGCFFPRDPVTSHIIELYLTMMFQYLESTLYTLVVAMSDKPRTSFQVVRNNLCENGMHKISEQVYFDVYMFIHESQPT